MTSISAVVTWNDSIILNPPMEEIEAAASLHVLGFSSNGDLLVAESEGSFTVSIWEQVLAAAAAACGEHIVDNNMHEVWDGSEHTSIMKDSLRVTFLEESQQASRWKSSIT